jgi:hypothetical protein
MWFHVMIKVEALWASELYFPPGRVHPAPGGHGAKNLKDRRVGLSDREVFGPSLNKAVRVNILIFNFRVSRWGTPGA